MNTMTDLPDNTVMPFEIKPLGVRGRIVRLGHVAEGVPCAEAALLLARRCHVELPIVSAVQAVLDGRSDPADAVRELLAREPRDEQEAPILPDLPSSASGLR